RAPNWLQILQPVSSASSPVGEVKLTSSANRLCWVLKALCTWGTALCVCTWVTALCVCTWVTALCVCTWVTALSLCVCTWVFYEKPQRVLGVGQLCRGYLTLF
uniref:Uncharacterized protein n=1 Tax=Callorhinchus milii TaxID=7868 RepID=A0A4W3HZF5_CALMI